MTSSKPFYSAYLKAELTKRMEAKRGFSLRSFARFLRVDPGTLSTVMNLKRPLTVKMANRILDRLNSPPSDRSRFLASVILMQKGRTLKRIDPKVRNFAVPEHQTPRALDIDLFHLIADWYHAAILELTYLEDFQADPRWIAHTLKISTHEAKTALDRLVEFGLLRVEDGRVRKVNDHLELANNAGTSEARKLKQKQMRQKAIESIENDPPSSRYMTTITMAIDPDLLDEARKRIEEFNDSLCAFLESGKRKQVYSMEIGLLPLQKKETRQ